MSFSLAGVDADSGKVQVTIAFNAMLRPRR
jgi:hypothetical protein